MINEGGFFDPTRSFNEECLEGVRNNVSPGASCFPFAILDGLGVLDVFFPADEGAGDGEPDLGFVFFSGAGINGLPLGRTSDSSLK